MTFSKIPNTVRERKGIRAKAIFIEAIHDGTFFHDKAKLGVFLPTGLILLMLAITGFVLFMLRQLTQREKAQRLRVLNSSQA